MPLAVYRGVVEWCSSTVTTSSATTMMFTRGWHGRPPSTRSDRVIIYAFGPDRPGVVSGLTKAVLDAKGNVEESRMARLGGDFNVMAEVSFDDAQALAGRVKGKGRDSWDGRAGSRSYMKKDDTPAETLSLPISLLCLWFPQTPPSPRPHSPSILTETKRITLTNNHKYTMERKKKERG